MKWWVRGIPTVMAFVVAAASFALSYVALRDVAAHTLAVPADMAWLVPICVDGAVLASSASIWASSMRGTKVDPVAVVTLVTLLAVSVVINVNHAGPEVLAKVIAALPPLTLLACLELVAGQYRSSQRDNHAQEAATGPSPADPHDTAAAGGGAPTLSELEVVTPVPHRPAAVPDGPAPTWEQPAASAPTPAPTVEDRPAADLVEAPVEAAARRPGQPVPGSRPTRPRDDEPAPARKARPAAERPPRQVPATTAAPRSGAAQGGPTMAEQIRQLWDEHLNAGGSPADPTLSRRFAEVTGAQRSTVRKVLAPLRRAATEDPDPVAG